MKKVLLTNGKIGSGKTTLVNNLLIHYSNTHCTLEKNFAHKLKSIAHELYGIPWTLLNGTQQDKSTLTEFVKCPRHANPNNAFAQYYTVREILQLLSDDVKQYDPHAWTKYLVKEILESDSGFILIGDWRFPHEFDFLNETPDLEVKTLKLTRKSGQQSNHNSETSLDNFQFDMIIDNKNLSVEETKNTAINWIDTWINK